MKRSKFLKSSKEMLSRSFNPSKCKMSLRLAASRLKLLRNKKEVQVNQMKREIAQLLQSGQDQTARIRVEHVIREEKMMAAYDLIEIYCELIVARLPIIESQKTCPIDLKEAITSIVFASPRCGDVPELLDVRKHFTEKYGKDFTTAAIELRPECGVSRMLVEKLSAKAPDGQTKIKILSAIAEEHNVKWDPRSFEEKDPIPPSDLLTGPSTFGKESKPHVEPPRFEGSDAQAPQSSNKIHGSPSNFSQLDHRTSQGASNGSAQTPGPYTAFQQEGRPAAPVDERAQLFRGDSNVIPQDRQRWNMEFKDATSAAQAAAESAERASMAARAAAELSSRGRIMRQHSTESHKSGGPVLKDGGPGTYVKPDFSEESMSTSFSEHTRLQNKHMDGQKPHNQKTDGRFRTDDHGGRKEYSQSASLRSEASCNDNSFDHAVPVVEGYSKNNSLKEVSGDEMTRQSESFKYKVEDANGWPGKFENVREERMRKQPSDEFDHPPSSIPDDVNIFSNSDNQKFGYDAGEDPFQGYRKESTSGEASHTSSHESAAVVFDKSDSDSEIYEFNLGPTYDEHGPRSFLPSSGQKSSEHLSINTDSMSSSSNIVKSTSLSPFFTRKNSSSDLSESLDGPKLDDSVLVTFDESDGPASESDEDMNVFRRTGMEDSRDFPTLEPKNSQMELNYINNSSPESGEGLNFGKLTGGLRHKGYNRAPYVKKQSDISSSFNTESKDTTTSVTKSTVPTAAGSPRISTRTLQKSSGHKQGKLYNLKSGKEVKTKPSRAASTSIFGSDSSDTDEDPPKESLTRTSYLRSGISQRTKASPSSSNNSYSKSQLSSDAPDFDGGVGRKPINASSPETRDQFQFSKKSSSQLGSSEQPTSTKVAFKPNNSSLRGSHNSEKVNSATMHESKITSKSSATEESSRPQPKAETYVSNENLKAAATLNKTSSNKDDSDKKASHVHPKLPDYDALVQSLRKNRS
ncbi:UNVERIFIED_CONTAM: IST1-like protein [Sesamum angustifolium]|uniref:IST1-like protein n=1 Tax=Sesamum angustifolium TaxID=2727405 RepID=A0AAW2JNX6_9LAMI